VNVLDGAQIRSPHEGTFDVVIIGSGPAGATVARALARAGARVAVVEEGRWHDPREAPLDGFSAMSTLYRGMGATLINGRGPMPYVQGRAVGGTSVINGAICWRLPRDVYDGWVKNDPALAEAIPWQRIEAELDLVERDLHIAPTDPAVAGQKNLLMAKGAQALGLEHRPIARNTHGCRGLGRCLQSCPEGRKMSMDRTFLPDAVEKGAVIFSSVEATELELRGGRCVGVKGRSAGGAEVRLKASRAVVLAASAIQTPLLLMRNGLRHGPVGQHFQGHPGVSVTARFREPVRAWEGATQGHEVIGLRKEGIKFEALGYDVSILAARRKNIGQALGKDIDELAHWLDWGAAIRATAEGSVRKGLLGPSVSLTMNALDMQRVRKGVTVLGQMMLAAGAESVAPGVAGWHESVTDPAVMARFEAEGSLDPRDYAMAVTHLFGTCRMGSDPATSVVRPDFRMHAVDALYVADSSVFPSNTGVNPQTSIMALAAICAAGIGAR
jgi:choline dehydrogenase-like flavoprotein